MGEIIKIERSSLVDNVASQMTNLIEDGTWKEGQKLASETQLAKDFAVSRVVIREAMQILRSKHLIVTKHGLGSYVWQGESVEKYLEPINLAQLSIEEVVSLFELRKCVEYRAMELIAEKHIAEDLEKIRDVYNEMAACQGGYEEYTVIDAKWHLTVVQCSHSKLLIKAYESCFQELCTVLREVNSVDASRTREYSLGIHRTACEAMEAGDAKRAKKAFDDSEKYTLSKVWSLLGHS